MCRTMSRTSWPARRSCAPKDFVTGKRRTTFLANRAHRTQGHAATDLRRCVPGAGQSRDDRQLQRRPASSRRTPRPANAARDSKAPSTRSSSIRRPPRTQGIEGDAVVRYWVPHRQRHTRDAEIVRSSGYPALDAAAIDTIRSGQFKKRLRLWPRQHPHRFQTAGLRPPRCSTSSSTSRRSRLTRAT